MILKTLNLTVTIGFLIFRIFEKGKEDGKGNSDEVQATRGIPKEEELAKLRRQ